jgi:hypothetical protein
MGPSRTVAMLASALGAIDFSFTIQGPWAFFEVEARHLDQNLGRA